MWWNKKERTGARTESIPAKLLSSHRSSGTQERAEYSENMQRKKIYKRMRAHGRTQDNVCYSEAERKEETRKEGEHLD